MNPMVHGFASLRFLRGTSKGSSAPLLKWPRSCTARHTHPRHGRLFKCPSRQSPTDLAALSPEPRSL
jgi:hypothetical protein